MQQGKIFKDIRYTSGEKTRVLFGEMTDRSNNHVGKMYKDIESQIRVIQGNEVSISRNYLRDVEIVRAAAFTSRKALIDLWASSRSAERL